MKMLLRKIFFILIPIVLFAAVYFALLGVAGSQPFGHDEAVYLTKARSWINGMPADEYGPYRPIGMVGFGWIFLNFGDSENFLRLFGVFFGSLSAGLLYLLFKRVTNTFVSIAVVAAVTSSYFFLQESPLFQNDVPSSGLLFGMLWSIYVYIESSGRSKIIYLAPIFGAAAFYIRYGASVPIAISLLLSVAYFLPVVLKDGVKLYGLLKKTFIIALLLFSPHFIYSYFEMGSPLGILSLSGKAAGRKYIGEGLVNYIQWLPHDMGGWLMGVAAIIGALMTLAIIFEKRLRVAYAGLGWLGSIGILSFIVTGLLVHAEARYVFFSVALLSGVGISGIYYLARSLSARFGYFIYAILMAFIFYTGTIYFQKAETFFDSKESDRYRVSYKSVSEFISNDSEKQGGCAIWAVTTYRPAVSWYSKCRTFSVTNAEAFNRDYLLSSGMVRYSVVLEKVVPGQITTQLAEKYGVELREVFRTNNLSYASRGDIIVYKIIKSDFSSSEENISAEREWFTP